MVTLEPQFSPTDGAAEPYTVLLPDGTLRDGATPSMSDDEVVEALRLMLLTRTFDAKQSRINRQADSARFP
ncbi:MAG: pyruvate dehydrogenase (acetyl-transferring) E1 component subunit alpha, partial [Actinobacteria bacterium]